MRVVTRFRSFPAHDVAVLAVLASEPDRRFQAQQVADTLGVLYATAWQSLRRLELHGLVLGGKLTDAGRDAMGIDGWDCPTCGAHHDEKPGRTGPAAPVDAPAPEAVPDPRDLF